MIIYSLDMNDTHSKHSGISLSQQSSVWGALSCLHQPFPLTGTQEAYSSMLSKGDLYQDCELMLGI